LEGRRNVYPLEFGLEIKHHIGNLQEPRNPSVSRQLDGLRPTINAAIGLIKIWTVAARLSGLCRGVYFVWSIVAMSRTPDLLISYDLSLPEEVVQPFISAIEAPGLVLVVEPRPPTGPMAGVLWLLPTTIAIWFARSYFDGFLREAGKDHYALLKRGLSSLGPLFFGENRAVRVTAVGTPGKIRPGDEKYSLGISIFAEAGSGLRLKLMFPDGLSAEGFNAATAAFLHFLERYYAGELDVSTEVHLGAAREVGGTIFATYDLDRGLFRFLDPISEKTDSDD